MGYDPLLFDSNGVGGFHLWVLFDKPCPTATVFDFAQWLVSDWQTLNLEKLPETFPKAVKDDSIGSWFRLPGLHHTRDHYSAVWAGDDGMDEPWLNGHAAIDAMLACVPGPMPVLPHKTTSNTRKSSANNPSRKKPKNTLLDAVPGYSPPKKQRRFTRRDKPTICVDLDGVLADRVEGSAIGPPISGAVEFTYALSERAEVVIYTARFSTKNGKPRSEKVVESLHKRIINWLDVHGFKYSRVNTTQAKPIASAYVDDRGVACQPLKDGIDAYQLALDNIDALCQH